MLDPIHAIRLRTVFGAAAAALVVIGTIAGCADSGAEDASVKTFTPSGATVFLADADLPAAFEVEGRPAGDQLQPMATRIEFEP
jgi:hypothetical protein